MKDIDLIEDIEFVDKNLYDDYYRCIYKPSVEAQMHSPYLIGGTLSGICTAICIGFHAHLRNYVNEVVLNIIIGFLTAFLLFSLVIYNKCENNRQNRLRKSTETFIMMRKLLLKYGVDYRNKEKIETLKKKTSASYTVFQLPNIVLVVATSVLTTIASKIHDLYIGDINDASFIEILSKEFRLALTVILVIAVIYAILHFVNAIINRTQKPFEDYNSLLDSAFAFSELSLEEAEKIQNQIRDDKVLYGKPNRSGT